MDPSFITHFKNRKKAIQACQMYVTAREENFTNKQIVQMPLFLSMFLPEYVQDKSVFQMEVKIKNMARDLKQIPFDKLDLEWHEFKTFFEGTRRK